jgi:hypothetical protein
MKRGPSPDVGAGFAHKQVVTEEGRPLDGQVTSLTANQAWLRARVMQHVVVNLRLMETMGRVVALTLLTPAEPSYGRVRSAKRRQQRLWGKLHDH